MQALAVYSRFSSTPWASAGEKIDLRQIPEAYKESKINTTKIMSKSLASATMSSQDFGSTGAGEAFALDLALLLQARFFGCASEAPSCNAKHNQLF